MSTENTIKHTIHIQTDLDVLSKFETLMTTSQNTSSTYIRTRETLDEMFKDFSINSQDKATIISNVMSSLTNSITTTSMQTALQWATSEKELALRKAQMEYELANIAADKALKDAQIDKMEHDSIAQQAETIRVMGKPTVTNGKVINLANDGKIYTDMQLVDKQTDNAEKEGSILDSKLNESFATIQKMVADTYVNYGSYTYTLTNSGLTDVYQSSSDYKNSLSYHQRIIAQEQAKGYAYNAWANAATSAAGMAGTALASDVGSEDGTVRDLILATTDAMTRLMSIDEAYKQSTP